VPSSTSWPKESSRGEPKSPQSPPFHCRNRPRRRQNTPPLALLRPRRPRRSAPGEPLVRQDPPLFFFRALAPPLQGRPALCRRAGKVPVSPLTRSNLVQRGLTGGPRAPLSASEGQKTLGAKCLLDLFYFQEIQKKYQTLQKP
jgi:hypothetical protein